MDGIFASTFSERDNMEMLYTAHWPHSQAHLLVVNFQPRISEWAGRVKTSFHLLKLQSLMAWHKKKWTVTLASLDRLTDCTVPFLKLVYCTNPHFVPFFPPQGTFLQFIPKLSNQVWCQVSIRKCRNPNWAQTGMLKANTFILSGVVCLCLIQNCEEP